MCKTHDGHFVTHTLKTLYSDILYNDKILYNVNCLCANVPVQAKNDCQ